MSNFDLPKLYVLIFFIVLSSLFTCALYGVSGDLDSFSNLGKGLKISLVLLAFAISFAMLALAVSENVHRNVKHLVYFILLIHVFIFMCFITLSFLKIIGVKINMFRATFYILIFNFCLYFCGFINKFLIRRTNYSIITEKNINLRIAFISDLHLGAAWSSARLLEKIVSVINDSKSDLVLLGGDIIEAKLNLQNSQKYAEIISSLKSKLGTYAILGNHEYYIGNVEKIIDFLEKECSIRVLLDEFLKIGENLILIGRTDGGHRRAAIRKNMDKIIGDVKNGNNFLLVLDHSPKYFNEAVLNGVDLQLSGHTHNGQFFPFNLLVKFFYEKPYGKLEKQGSTLITSSGVGTWGPPIKLFSKPEVMVVDIKNK
ncbi:MAG: metallophosphoesterase [Rickettsiales bacterium]|jgi:predicted MPP superfamily phosphohydrolase|nr:metallophosphoesterase [Rickettsiales bacterium]